MYNTHTNKALKLAQVNTIIKAIETSDAKRFENSLTLAGLIADGNKWLKDAEGQTWLKSTKMAMDEFIQKTYGFQKSFYYKLLKAANVPADVVKEFTTQTAKLKAEKLSAPLSIEALLKYYSEAKLETAKDSDGDGDGDGDGENEAHEVKAKAKAVLTFTFKVDGFEPVSLRIDDDGQFKTQSTGDAIAVALDYLAQAVAGAGLSPKAPKVKAKAKDKALPKPNTAKAPKPTKQRKAEILNALDMTFEDVTFEDVI